MMNFWIPKATFVKSETKNKDERIFNILHIRDVENRRTYRIYDFNGGMENVKAMSAVSMREFYIEGYVNVNGNSMYLVLRDWGFPLAEQHINPVTTNAVDYLFACWAAEEMYLDYNPEKDAVDVPELTDKHRNRLHNLFHERPFLDHALYVEYIESDHWIALRNKIVDERKKCEICNHDRGLQVHHLHYLSLGVEKDEDLLLVCLRCHDVIHNGNWITSS
jgi:hypothetical protein